MPRTYAPRGAYALCRDQAIYHVVEVVHDNPLQTYMLQPLDVAGLPLRGTLPAWVAYGEVVKHWSTQSSFDEWCASRWMQ